MKLPIKAKLKIWNGRACSPIYDHFYVCAFNQKDAGKLIVQAKRSIDNQNPIQDWEIARMTREIKVYFGKGCWGTSMDGIKQERGVWATTKNDRIPKRLNLNMKTFNDHIQSCETCRESSFGHCPEALALLLATDKPVNDGVTKQMTAKEHNAFPAGRWNRN